MDSESVVRRVLEKLERILDFMILIQSLFLTIDDLKDGGTNGNSGDRVD